MDVNELVEAAYKALQSEAAKAVVAAAGGGIAFAGEQGSRLWSWIKEKLRGPAAEGAIKELEADAGDEDNWAALKIQLGKALKGDPGLADELRGLLGVEGPGGVVNQTATGRDGNVIVQSVGDQGKLTINH